MSGAIVLPLNRLRPKFVENAKSSGKTSLDRVCKYRHISNGHSKNKKILMEICVYCPVFVEHLSGYFQNG